jgi:hypothetical protein
METLEKNTLIAPPRLIPSFAEGFNAVAGNIRLIILPVILDLLLWFGPRVSVKGLIEPLVTRYMNFLISRSASADVQTMLASSQLVWEEALTRFSLTSLLRTLPIGVPSLLSGRGIMANPLGVLSEIGLTSFGVTLFIWLAFCLIGLAGGSVFFSEIARVSLKLKDHFSFQHTLKMFRDTIYLTLSAYVLLALLVIPALIIVAIFALISPTLSQFALIVAMLMLIWLLVPLVFSPHGIYSAEQNVFTSAINSIRLVRYFLPGTGIFILISVLMSQGLDVLWTFPTEDSWMVLVGILGHAFVSTGLITASFIYYRGGVKWMNEKMRQVTGKTI